MEYNFREIEAKWQKYWAENKTFKAENESEAPKYYVLDMFPYPSGAGLHVGHPLGYIASDIYARYKRHCGFNVLHPMGYDSFGLPAEQYAIQTGQHPALTTQTNIDRYREQLDKIGFSFDWDREVRTSSANYYKWTQWIFGLLFNAWYDLSEDRSKPISSLISQFEKNGNEGVQAAVDSPVAPFTAAQWREASAKGQEDILQQYRLTYLAEAQVNWCPALGTVLANDEIVNGVSERGGHPVVRKKMLQWSMRISAFAERLLQDLSGLDWPQPLKDSQTNWIGKSVGAMVTFKTKPTDWCPELLDIEVFTTRPDTIFGVSFMTLAPEHEYVEKICSPQQRAAVEAYVQATAKRSERERMADVKTISGVFTGAYATHPLTGEAIPIWIGDYVLAGYGSGAVMAVPCGDQRDFDFATHFNIPIPNIFEGVDISQEAYTQKEGAVIAHSDFLSGLPYKEALTKAIEALEAKGAGYGKVNYRLRDAVFSRQRYWGEPFPIYYKNGVPTLIDLAHLPVVLPEVDRYLPTETGAPPLGNATHWAWCTKTHQVVANDLIDQESVFPMELNTMPGWAGSSFYFNRYMDPSNTEEMLSEKAAAYWQEVDLYIGGSEHATGHLLYARFWQKFLYDMGLVPQKEFAKKLINQGMITGTSAFVYRLSGTQTFVSKNRIAGREVEPLHVDVSMVNLSDELDIDAFKAWREEYASAQFELEDNGVYIVGREVEKMSKSKFNVVSPDAICEQYGADSLRLYEMFLGPLEQSKPWNTAGITGTHGFLKKLWKLYFNEAGPVFQDVAPTAENLKTLHKTIKKATEDIENFSFNTSVSTFMICVNELHAQGCKSKEILEALAILVSPYAPHMAEELWAGLGHNTSISKVPFPQFNPAHLVESEKEYPISFNGKMRFKMKLPMDLSKEEIEAAVMAYEKTKQQLDGRTPKKVIVVPGKIINIVG
ncbi:leucine--tRNA ligase [Flavobacteriaceae bacterium LSUCC0859]|nr:leucine--tRNA ligase [Flavobacteriaceae bacterium LSUCC0859]